MADDNPAPGTGTTFDPQDPESPEQPTTPETTEPTPEAEAPVSETSSEDDEAAEVRAAQTRALDRAQKVNAELREELARERAAKADPNETSMTAEIRDADIEGGPSAAPELPEYKEGETKTFTLTHELVNSTEDGLKRYKPDVPYTLPAQTADDLMRRDQEYADYQRRIHIRETMIQPIGTISGNG